MFIPLRTDRTLRHTPWVNRALILINVIVFAATFRQIEYIGLLQHKGWTQDLIAQEAPLFDHFLHTGHWTWLQLLSYQFLHGDIWHLLGNMLFLYVFGNAVEDRLRPWGYAGLYLIGGMVAAAAQIAWSQVSGDHGPVLGASGSVAAVTGAFLALCPKTRVTVLFVFILIAFFEVPSMYIIFFYFLKDLLLQSLGGTGVAYMAHIGGTLFGFAIGMALLGLKILPREPYDFLALAHHWNRRRQFRSLDRRGMEPWAAQASRKMEEPMSQEQQELAGRRQAVFDALGREDNLAAARAYDRLLEADAEQVLPRIEQADLANRAMQAQQYGTAAAAYRKLLEKYPNDAQTPEARLMLALLLHRYLGRSAEALPHLRQLTGSLGNTQHQIMAEQMLREAESAAGSSESNRYKF
ncbi:MAG: rhomboid family intramembrane serine protease [Phycisphaeraceae bacterium]|nr:rhomboid family intramembrane serine protease [Phycisphaeraceae bacterium]